MFSWQFGAGWLLVGLILAGCWWARRLNHRHQLANGQAVLFVPKSRIALARAQNGQILLALPGKRGATQVGTVSVKFSPDDPRYEVYDLNGIRRGSVYRGHITCIESNAGVWVVREHEGTILDHERRVSYTFTGAPPLAALCAVMFSVHGEYVLSACAKALGSTATTEQ